MTYCVESIVVNAAGMTTSLRDTQRTLAVTMEDLKSKDQEIQHLKKQLKDRDLTIVSLQTELRRFQDGSSVQSKSVITSIVAGLEEHSGKPQHGRDGYSSSIHYDVRGDVDAGSYLNVVVGPKTSAGRIKRMAISAEPLEKTEEKIVDEKETDIKRWPKALE